MAALTHALQEARGGRGSLVMLAGSGGMGKTRLARELAARAEADGVSVLWGRCPEEPGAPPYWPWRQLIRRYLRSGHDADSRLLVIGTYRDAELSRQHPLSETLAELARPPVFHRLELSGLSGRETEAFVAAAGFASASTRLLQAMHERTEGHPLFLEETRCGRAGGSRTG